MRKTRRLASGRSPALHANKGLRKRCACSRRRWNECEQVWHFSFAWRGQQYRFALDDAHWGALITDAESERDRLQAAIGAGTFQREPVPAPVQPTADAVTFRQLGNLWLSRVRQPSVASGKLASTRTDLIILRQWNDVELAPGERLGDRAVARVTEDDLEVAFGVLVTNRAASTTNKIRGVLLGVQRFGVRKGYVAKPWLSENHTLGHRTPAKRERRLFPDEEAALLKAASPWLRNLIVAAIETGCRKGELLSLRWGDVNLPGGVLNVRAENSKTRTARGVPLSPRIKAILTFLRTGPDGQEHPPTAYVFGDPLGRQAAGPRKAWSVCVLTAHGHTPEWTAANGLTAASQAALAAVDHHFHDLRRECGSRLFEAGWALHHVAAFLGHKKTTTTDTYLRAETHHLLDSMQRFGTGLHNLAHPPAGELLPGVQETRREPAQVTVN